MDDIEGYCGVSSVRQGAPISLHVSTRADRFDVMVERWGAQRVPVWETADVPGVFVPAPPDADANGCRWSVSLMIPTTQDWKPGFYLITLRASGAPVGRDMAHAGVVVRARRPSNAALLVLATNTWNAYNTWGGRSLYTGGTQVSFRRPFGRGMLCRDEVDRDDRKARPVRWGEEPDVDGAIFQEYRTERGYPAAVGSTGWFSHERRFVEWAEAEGHEFDYAVSSDLDPVSGAFEPGEVEAYDRIIGVGHDEYWSAGMRDTVEAHVRRGGHVASFSGNTMFWQVRLEGATVDPAAAHDPTATMVCHKYTAHQTDPVIAAGRPEAMTGMWADPMVGRPEAAFLGGGSAWGLYHRFGQATARGSGGFTVYRNDHWLFAGTGLRYGDVLGAKHGVVGYETLGCRIQFDEYQLPVPAGGDDTPDDLELVAFTPSSNLGVGEYPASISALSDQGDLEFIASRLHGRIDDDSLARVRHGNAVMVVGRPFGATGGEVVTIGTTDWVFGLNDDPAVAQVTRNVLDRDNGATPVP